MENISNPVTQKWYNKKALVFLLCVVFFPVGLYGVFKSDTIGKVGKGIGVLYLVFWLFILFSPTDEKATANANAAASSAPVEKELTKAQVDSTRRADLTEVITKRKANTVDADVLVRIYENNEVSADNDFKGTEIYVEGTIESIAKDVLDKAYIVLASDNGVNGVQCYLADERTAAALNKGEKVTIRGTVKDKIILNVVMEDCEPAESLANMRSTLKLLSKN